MIILLHITEEQLYRGKNIQMDLDVCGLFAEI